jgi:hypothetical protein
MQKVLPEKPNAGSSGGVKLRSIRVEGPSHPLSFSVTQYETAAVAPLLNGLPVPAMTVKPASLYQVIRPEAPETDKEGAGVPSQTDETGSTTGGRGSGFTITSIAARSPSHPPSVCET